MGTEFRQQLTRWPAELGANVPGDTAAVLTAAMDEVILHRALNLELTASMVAPLLCRLMTSGTTAHENT